MKYWRKSCSAAALSAVMFIGSGSRMAFGAPKPGDKPAEAPAKVAEKPAEKVDLNPVYMGQIERGYKVPTVDVLLRIAKALKVRMRDLFEEL